MLEQFFFSQPGNPKVVLIYGLQLIYKGLELFINC